MIAAKRTLDTHMEYTPWVDFYYETETNKRGNVLFYFRWPDGALLWFVKTFYQEDTDGDWVLKRGYIVDTVSAYKLEQNVSDTKMLDIFKENGYKGYGVPDFWTAMYEVVLTYFQEHHWSDTIIYVNSLEKNRWQIHALLRKVQERTRWIIKNFRGWDNDFAANVYLQ